MHYSYNETGPFGDSGPKESVSQIWAHGWSYNALGGSISDFRSSQQCLTKFHPFCDKEDFFLWQALQGLNSQIRVCVQSYFVSKNVHHKSKIILTLLD